MGITQLDPIRWNLPYWRFLNKERAELPDIDIEPNSLATFIQTDNRYARRYADFILGNVICCESLAELENYSSAITKDCMVYKNYVSRKIDPKI